MAMGITRLKVIAMDWNSSGDIPLQPLPQVYIVEKKKNKNDFGGFFSNKIELKSP